MKWVKHLQSQVAILGALFLDQHVLEILREVLTESVIHTGTMLPLLFFVFILVEIISHRPEASKLTRAFAQPYLGPVAAAALGLIPQCGFSVVATTLFVEGVIPMGSLLSAYISTSDEALPIMMSDPTSLPWVLPLVVTKFLWGMVAGICINTAILKRAGAKPVRGAEKTDDLTGGQAPDLAIQSKKSGLRDADLQKAQISSLGRRSRRTKGQRIEGVLSHALVRTLRIGAIIFLLSAGLNILGHSAQRKITAALSKPGFWQPAATAVIGLIPSCATSVVLAEGFRSGMLSFSATVSGLTSNAGMGLLILIKEARRKGEVLTVIVLLTLSAVLVGILTAFLLP